MRGSVTKKDGRYFIVYTVGKRIAKTGPRAGQLVPKQKWEKVPEPNTKKNAEKLLAMRVAEINRGEYQEIRKGVFSEFAERWLRDYVDDPNHIKPSSAYHYRGSSAPAFSPSSEILSSRTSRRTWCSSSYPSAAARGSRRRRSATT